MLGIINEKNDNDIQALLNGDKPKTGAQWERGGRGYLDRPGYWFLALHEQLSCDHPDINALLHEVATNPELKASLQNTQSVNEVIGILVEHHITISPTDWLAYYAQCILKANDGLADQMTR